MSLRINTNMSAISALNSLENNNNALSKSLRKLSSGYRINVAADDPAGLVISEALRSQLAGLKQAVENSQNAANMIGTAEGALIEMNDILNSMRQLAVHAASDGTSDRDQVEADQAQMDSAIRSIDRIANTTKFAGKYLLNGSQGYNYTAAAGIVDTNITRAQIYQGQTVSAVFNITTAATMASGNLCAVTGTGPATIAVSGALGTEFITVASGATAATIGTAINQLTANTGVAFSGTTVYSTKFGSLQFVELTKVGGSGTVVNITKTYGADTKATMNGQTVAADGLTATVSTSFFAGEVVFSAATTGVRAIEVTSGGGMVFQLGAKGAPNEQEYMGIKAMHSTYLGDSVNGFLTTIRTGGANDLFTNPEQAILVIDSAINRVSSLRAQMGAFQKNTLMTNINSLNVSIENITNSESRIRDANIAQETTEFVKNQILTQTGTTVLAQANSAAQSVLSLLQ